MDISYIINKDKISFTTYDLICNKCNTYNYPWKKICVVCNNHIDIQNNNVYISNEYQRKSNEHVYKYYINKYNINTHTILDLGCSYGSWYDRFKNIGFTCIYGIDVNENVLEKAKLKYNKCICGTSSDIINNFGLQKIICCNSVIIHVREENEIIKIFNDVYNSLENNGFFIVSLPNTLNPKQCNNDIVFNYNLNYYEKIINNSGFKILDKKGIFSFINKNKIFSNISLFETIIKIDNSERDKLNLFDEILYLLVKK